MILFPGYYFNSSFFPTEYNHHPSSSMSYHAEEVKLANPKRISLVYSCLSAVQFTHDVSMPESGSDRPEVDNRPLKPKKKISLETYDRRTVNSATPSNAWIFQTTCERAVPLASGDKQGIPRKMRTDCRWIFMILAYS